MSLHEKVAIVTGASRGIGRQIAIQLAASGVKVVVNYSSYSGKAEEAVQTIEASGGEAAAIRADVSKVGEVETLFAETLERFGRLDILVNNAGIMECTAIEGERSLTSRPPSQVGCFRRTACTLLRKEQSSS